MNANKKMIIYQPTPKEKRIKFFIPYAMYEKRKLIKEMDTSFWHPNQKLWSVVNTVTNFEKVKHLLGDGVRVETVHKEVKAVPIRSLNDQAITALFALEKALGLKRYSQHTVKTYKSMFCIFLFKFMDFDLKAVTKDQIEGFVYELIKKHGYGESAQNQLINAIKFYYEQVLGKKRTFYDIKRPKKAQTIPNILSEAEVFKIINAPKNLKHKAILWTIYSTGIRISEAITLRVDDIHSDQGFVFVKSGKGKKDRRTILSPHLLDLLRSYYKSYKPSYWLFEGQTGGQYSVSSIRAIFRKAVKITNSNPWATVHTLRHSFATHCVQNNINLRHIQSMLGHSSPKTTEIYTRTIKINNKSVTSPLDKLLNSHNFTKDNTKNVL